MITVNQPRNGDAELRVRYSVGSLGLTTARGQGSTGLGMHIVFNVVTATLGGTISCTSEPGQGTSFRVTVPLTAPTEE